MEHTDPRFVEAYRARNLPEAHTIRVALEEEGILVQIDGDLLQGAVGDLPLGWATAPRVLVEESQAARARGIIERAVAARRAEPVEDDRDEAVSCLACGQEMGEAETCPACGWSYQAEGGA